MEAQVTRRPLTLSSAAVTGEVLFKGSIWYPSHGPLASRSCMLSIEDEAWSWRVDAGEWMRQTESQLTELK